jgi:hypothetical protein
MRRYRVPLGMLTIFHPDEFWGVDVRQLATFPVVKKDREKQELFKERLANDTGAETRSERFHNRIIKNFGKPQNLFRKTWITGNIISLILSDYQIRLIETLKEEGQARYKLEARPNWGDERNILPHHLVDAMKNAIFNSTVSIRQIWINPFIDASEGVQVTSPFYELGATVNLVLGPYDEEDCLRKANVRFTRDSGLHNIHQHRPYFNYKGLSNQAETTFLSNCSMWWIEY